VPTGALGDFRGGSLRVFGDSFEWASLVRFDFWGVELRFSSWVWVRSGFSLGSSRREFTEIVSRYRCSNFSVFSKLSTDFVSGMLRLLIGLLSLLPNGLLSLLSFGTEFPLSAPLRLGLSRVSLSLKFLESVCSVNWLETATRSGLRFSPFLLVKPWPELVANLPVSFWASHPFFSTKVRFALSILLIFNLSPCLPDLDRDLDLDLGCPPSRSDFCFRLFLSMETIFLP
jgi:hypothetical protein